MYTYPEKEKITVVNRYLNGEKISQISQSTKISRTTIYLWIKNATTLLIKEKLPISVIYTIYKKNATDNKRLSKYCNAHHVRRARRYQKDTK